MAIAEESIYEALKQVHDPELMINVVDLGLIYEVSVSEVDGKSNVKVKMTMTSPACPFAPQLVREAKETLANLEEVGEAEVEVTLSPPWSPDRMTEDARDELGLY